MLRNWLLSGVKLYKSNTCLGQIAYVWAWGRWKDAKKYWLEIKFFKKFFCCFNILLACRILKRAEHTGIIHTDFFFLEPQGFPVLPRYNGRIPGTKMYTALDFSWSCFWKWRLSVVLTILKALYHKALIINSL